ncbi:hypothetical protein EVAR_13769_1 [Eumeta japonica]|uniref:Uncharacterized protein n=1 Tax=Eumeta variegata TaxID=151549 RepID=A0A4C1U0W2_EUMVA|nr:hypothetical protein EVAR_13769_1 [Eumeta japonica]
MNRSRWNTLRIDQTTNDVVSIAIPKSNPTNETLHSHKRRTIMTPARADGEDTNACRFGLIKPYLPARSPLGRATLNRDYKISISN